MGSHRKAGSDVALLRRSDLFDAAWYLEKYPDVSRAGADPVLHYLADGAIEGRDPGPRFSSLGYLELYPEVAASKVNPLVHYLQYGRAQGFVLADPFQVSVRTFLARRFSFLAPLHLRAVSDAPLRVTIITDTISDSYLFGGVATAIIFGALLAQRMACGLRIVTTVHPPEPSNFEMIVSLHGVGARNDTEFVYCGARGRGEHIELGARDLFITTSWWATFSVKGLIPDRQIVQMVQEDERMFYPFGDEHLLCSEILSSMNHRFVVNSRILFDHFVREGNEAIAQNGVWFEPAFPAAHYFPEDKRAGEKLQFFFYARPNNMRNLYGRGLEAIDRAIAEGVLDANEWDFNFVGQNLANVTLARGARPRLHQGLKWLDYVALVRRMDLGLSLIYTPHPSYPPLDLAACGAVAVTNRFVTKTSLAQYSPNILCSDLSVESLVAGLAAGARLARDRAARLKNFRNSGVGRDWSKTMDRALAEVSAHLPT